MRPPVRSRLCFASSWLGWRAICRSLPVAEAAVDLGLLSLDQRRSRRKHPVRAKTVNMQRFPKRLLEQERLLYPDVGLRRPRVRGECYLWRIPCSVCGGAGPTLPEPPPCCGGSGLEHLRLTAGGEYLPVDSEGYWAKMDAPPGCLNLLPCPWVGCSHNVYLDVSPLTDAIKLNFPDLEPWEMTESCVLDVAARGGTPLEDVGAIMNITRERIRQVENAGVLHARAYWELLEQQAEQRQKQRQRWRQLKLARTARKRTLSKPAHEPVPAPEPVPPAPSPAPPRPRRGALDPEQLAPWCGPDRGPCPSEGNRLFAEAVYEVSTYEVAKHLGTNRFSVSLWARGKVIPQLPTKAKIQQLYGIPQVAWRLPPTSPFPQRQTWQRWSTR
jgi:hypothetical protein